MTTPKLSNSTCQCPGCALYFTSTSTFDQHRAWANEDGEPWTGKSRPVDYDQRVCLEPRDIGLVLNSRGCYGNKPMTDEQKAARGWVA